MNFFTQTLFSLFTAPYGSIPNCGRVLEASVIQDLVDQGADPNSTNEDGATPLGILMAKPFSNLNEIIYYEEALITLIFNGANPLLNDRALLVCPPDGATGFTECMRLNLIETVRELEFALGVKVSTPNNENLLHLFAREDPRQLATALSYLSKPEDPKREVVLRWAMEPNTAGQTPIHLIWTHSAFYAPRPLTSAGVMFKYHLAEAAWCSLNVLDDLEKALFSVDQNGVSVMDSVIHHIENRSALLRNSLIKKRVMALHEARVMATQTRAVEQPNPPSRRI